MLYFTADIITKAADILHLDSEDTRRAKDTRQNARRQFAETYLDQAGKLTIANQTACVLAIQFGLLTPQQQQLNGDFLTDLVRQNDGKLNTGFVGTAWLLWALSQTGHDDVAYQLLQETRFPPGSTPSSRVPPPSGNDGTPTARKTASVT